MERDTFPTLAAAGRLYAIVDDAYWIDTGTPEGYLRANVDVLGGRTGRTVEGVVDGSWRHPSAVVDPGATLRVSVVDAGASVGAGAVVENAVLLPGAAVEAGARVRSSIIGPGAVIGEFATLDATCVVGAREHVAAGSVLSGDVRLGGVSAKQVLAGGAHEVGARPLAEQRRVEPADEGEGRRGRLAQHEVGGRGDLVGDRHLGGLEHAAEGVARPAKVEDSTRGRRRRSRRR